MPGDVRGFDSRVRRMARVNSLRLLAARTAFQGRLAFSEAWAFSYALRLFTTPGRHAIPPRERLAMRGARRVDLALEGDRLATWVWGQSERRVALLHGWEGRGSQWHAFIVELRAAGMQVIVVDPPAHGLSRGWSRADLPLFIKSLFRVEEEFGPITCVVGHSLGGTAIVGALELGLHAERAAIISAPARPRNYWLALLRALGLAESRIPAFDGRFADVYGFSWEELDMVRVASRCTVEALVIHDRWDREVPCDEAALLAEAWRGARFHMTDGLGHRRILCDGAVVGAVTRFAAGRTAGDRCFSDVEPCA